MPTPVIESSTVVPLIASIMNLPLPNTWESEPEEGKGHPRETEAGKVRTDCLMSGLDAGE